MEKAEKIEVIHKAKRFKLVRVYGHWTCIIELVTPSGMNRIAQWTATTEEDALQGAVSIAHQWVKMGQDAPQPAQERQESQPQAVWSRRPQKRRYEDRGPISLENVADREWPFGDRRKMGEFSDEELAKLRAWLEQGPGASENPKRRKLAFVLLKFEEQRRNSQAQQESEDAPF